MMALGGMIMRMQLVRMVTMMKKEKSGWTRTKMATRRMGLKGDKSQMALVALNR